MELMCRVLFMPVLLLTVLTGAGCDADDGLLAEGAGGLVGFWSPVSSTDSLRTFERTGALPDNAYGFGLMDDHGFVERKNAGGCATPPITYADYEGTWSLSDSVLHITVGYWGGDAHYRWRILDVDVRYLTVVEVARSYTGLP